MPLLLLFPDLGPFADLAAQVVQFGAPDVTDAQDLDLVDLGRMDRKRPLDTDSERVLANGKGLPGALALTLDDDALEHLDTAAGSLDDLEVHLDGIPRLELGNPFPQLLLFDSRYCRMHGFSLPKRRPMRHQNSLIRLFARTFVPSSKF